MNILFDILQTDKLICFIVLTVAIVFIIMFLFFMNTRRKNKMIIQRINNIEITMEYVLNYNDNSCLTFETYSFQTKTISIDDYYALYPSSFKDELTNWLILQKNSNENIHNDKYLRKYIYNDRLKNTVYTIFEFKKVCDDKSRLYIEEHIFPSMTKSKICKSSNDNLLKEKYFLNYLQKRKKRKQFLTDVAYYCINFRLADNYKDGSLDVLSTIVIPQIINNAMLLFDKKYHYISIYHDSSILIINTNCNDKIDAIKFIDLLFSRIESFLKMNNYKDKYVYKCGIKYLKKYNKKDSIANCIEDSYKTSEKAFILTNNNKYLFFNDHLDEYKTIDVAKKEEALEIINSCSEIKRLFSPVYSSQRKNTAGFIFKEINDYQILESQEDFENIMFEEKLVLPYITNLITYIEKSFYDFDKKATVMRTVILPIRLFYLDYIIEYFKSRSQINDDLNKIQFYFEIPLDDFKYSNKNSMYFSNILDILISNNCSLALGINQLSKPINDDLLNVFNLIIIHDSITSKIIDDIETNILLHNLLKNLKKLKTPLFVDGITTLKEYDLLNSYGCEYFAGTFFGKDFHSIQKINSSALKDIAEYERKKEEEDL